MSFLLHGLQAQMTTIAADLDTFSDGLKVVVVLNQSLLSFVCTHLHEQGDVRLYVKSGDIERAICCRRDLYDKERVGSLDEMAAFVEHNTIYIQMSSLVDNCVTLTGSW